MAKTQPVITERLRERLEAAGFSQAGLAREIGVSQGTIAKLAVGLSDGSKHLHTIAKTLGTTTAYLTGEADDPTEGAPLRPTAHELSEQLDVVQVPLLDLKFGMGGGTVLDEYHEPKMLSLSRDWVRIFTNSDPQYLFLATGIGDSMFPTIGDGDLMLCDRSQTNPVMSDQIWALTQYGHGMIKRLRPMENGYKILSDNQNVPPETAVGGSMSIIGRVVAVMRRT